MTDDRENLGRLVHDTRLAHEADQAAAEGRARFHLKYWEERTEAQRELDMRIGSAVATRAVHDAGLVNDRLRMQLASLADERSALADADNAIGQVLRHAWSWQEQGGHLEASEVARVLLLVLDAWTGRAEKRSDEDEAFTPDVGHPTAADRAMVARATGGGIRSREVQAEFSGEEAAPPLAAELDGQLALPGTETP